MADAANEAADVVRPCYPNKIGRILLLSLEEMVGRISFAALLERSGNKELAGNYPPNDLKREFPLADVADVLETMTGLYGARGTQGIERRAGQFAFQLVQKEFWTTGSISSAKATGAEGKLQPLLEGMAQLLDIPGEQSTRIEDDGQTTRVVAANCPVCLGRSLTAPACFLVQGMLEEAVQQVGDQRYLVHEVSCRGMGADACIWSIERRPEPPTVEAADAQDDKSRPD
ncbi:MAG: 4-vinyl reductase [Herpetosiphon sp.]